MALTVNSVPGASQYAAAQNRPPESLQAKIETLAVPRDTLTISSPAQKGVPDDTSITSFAQARASVSSVLSIDPRAAAIAQANTFPANVLNLLT
jgi:hypothetical protein